MANLAAVTGIETVKIGEWYSQKGCNTSRVLILKMGLPHASVVKPGAEWITIIQCVEHWADFSHQRLYTIDGNYDLTWDDASVDFAQRVLQLSAVGRRNDAHTISNLANMLKLGGS